MGRFFTIWIGQAFSLLGSQMVQFALVWWLARTSGSATVLAMATLVGLLPQILLGPFAGALVDRWSRKTVMIAADGLTALATLALALLFWIGLANLWAVYALLLVRAMGTTFHLPALQASTTLLVPREHLGRVGGLNQALAGLVGIFIPPLGALAVEALPMQAVLGIDVATAIPAIATLLIVPIPQLSRPAAQPASAQGPSYWDDLRAGLRLLFGWKPVLILVGVGVVIHMLGRAAGSLTPLMVLREFRGGAPELGWWQAVEAVGAVAGGLLLGAWGGFRRRIFTQMLALALDGAVIVAIALVPARGFPIALALIFAVGFLEAIILGLGGAIFQTIVPPEMQGRLFSLVTSLTLGLAPLGLLVAGPAADAFGLRPWWAASGVVFALMALGTLLVPSVMHLEESSSRAGNPLLEQSHEETHPVDLGQP